MQLKKVSETGKIRFELAFPKSEILFVDVYFLKVLPIKEACYPGR